MVYFCRGIISKNGKQCVKMALKCTDFLYCGYHKHLLTSPKSSDGILCRGIISKNGKQCVKMALKCTDFLYCGYHKPLNH